MDSVKVADLHFCLKNGPCIHEFKHEPCLPNMRMNLSARLYFGNGLVLGNDEVAIDALSGPLPLITTTSKKPHQKV